MFTYLFHEYFRADEAWKAWGNEQIDAYTFQHTPRDGRLYTIHGNQPAIFFIPSSRYYSNDLSNFLQELEAGSTATYAINSRGEREREDSLICTAYHQAHCPVIEIAITHSLSLSALFNRSRPRVSAFPRVQSSGRPFPPERKLENLGFSTE